MLIDDLLKLAVRAQASDVHLAVGQPPVFRINGTLIPQKDYAKLSPEQTAEMLKAILDEQKFQVFQQQGEIDFAYSLHGSGRFRVNAFYQRGTISIVLRLINTRIPTLEELNLPSSLQTLTNKNRGLILVTGPTGSGKSTTLAALIDCINSQRNCHIITLEDPIEYMHQHKKCIVNQREIGSDSHSFASALKAALRQDPDVILVGEMRDLETIAVAITAAETGHLVFATLHTGSAAQTVDRIIDVFPPHQQQQVRVQLAETLQGIVSQQLIPRVDQPGRIAAVEILMATPAIRNLIREGKTHQLVSSIQTGGKHGMQTMDMSLRNLFQMGLISREETFQRGSDAANLNVILE